MESTGFRRCLCRTSRMGVLTESLSRVYRGRKLRQQIKDRCRDKGFIQERGAESELAQHKIQTGEMKGKVSEIGDERNGPWGSSTASLLPIGRLKV